MAELSWENVCFFIFQSFSNSILFVVEFFKIRRVFDSRVDEKCTMQCLDFRKLTFPGFPCRGEMKNEGFRGNENKLFHWRSLFGGQKFWATESSALSSSAENSPGTLSKRKVWGKVAGYEALVPDHAFLYIEYRYRESACRVIRLHGSQTG